MKNPFEKMFEKKEKEIAGSLDKENKEEGITEEEIYQKAADVVKMEKANLSDSECRNEAEELLGTSPDFRKKVIQALNNSRK
jgi:hypothetical protein